MQEEYFISESCSFFHREENSATALIMEGLSGIGIDRLGSYSECVKDPNLRYFLFEYKMEDREDNVFTGVCYSSNCSAEDLAFVTRSMSHYMTFPFTEYRIFEPQADEVIWNPYTITLLAIVFLFVLPVLIASLIVLIGKINKKEKGKTTINKKAIEILSLQSSLEFFWHKSSNNERIKVLSGLRAFAFLGMTLFNMTTALSQIPTSPESPHVRSHLMQLYYMFDLWLGISGFYFAFELEKLWLKRSSKKIVFYTFVRKVAKTLIITAICAIALQAMLHSVERSPLWSLSLEFLGNACMEGNVLGCTYGSWVWMDEVIMAGLMALYFLLWKCKHKYAKILLIIINILMFSGFFAISFFLSPGMSADNVWSYSKQNPFVSCIAYQLGFHFGILYFSFRTNRNKENSILLKFLKFRMSRVIVFVLSASALISVYLYFIFIAHKIHSKGNLAFLFVFHIIVVLSYFAIVAGELVGFENAFGALLKDYFMGLISKISFSSYTIFYGVSLMIINSRKEDLYINSAKVLGLWACSLAVSVTMGFFVCIFFEIPIYRYLHLVFGRTPPKGFVEFY